MVVLVALTLGDEGETEFSIFATGNFWGQVSVTEASLSGASEGAIKRKRMCFCHLAIS